MIARAGEVIGYPAGEYLFRVRGDDSKREGKRARWNFRLDGG